MDAMERIYLWYLEYMTQVEYDLRNVRTFVSPARPDHDPTKRLSKAEFTERLMRPGRNSNLTKLWLRRIVRGREDDVKTFPKGIQALFDVQHQDSNGFMPPPSRSDETREAS